MWKMRQRQLGEVIFSVEFSFIPRIELIVVSLLKGVKFATCVTHPNLPTKREQVRF